VEPLLSEDARQRTVDSEADNLTKHLSGLVVTQVAAPTCYFYPIIKSSPKLGLSVMASLNKEVQGALPVHSLHIVRLDGIHFPAPIFTIPHTYTEYPNTSPSEVPARIRDAHVILTTRVPLSRENLSASQTPLLKLIAVTAVGTDNIDLDECEKRGIPVCNVPAASNEAVSEHAFALLMGECSQGHIFLVWP
jgi:hypothetical protein